MSIMLVSNESMEFHYEEQEPLLMPILDDNLAKCKINGILLQSNEFSKIISRFDKRDETVKSLLVDAFAKNDQDIYNLFRDKDNFLKNVLNNSIQNDRLDINVQEFVYMLWNLDSQRPQIDVCIDIHKSEKIILNEINKIVKGRTYIKGTDLSNTDKVILEFDFKLRQLYMQQIPNELSTYKSEYSEEHQYFEKLSRKPFIPENHVKEWEDNKNASIKKTVLLLYEANNMNNLKSKQINSLKEKLDYHSIDYLDLNTLLNNENWKLLITEELRKDSPIFILYDEYLDGCFDDKKNKDNDCKYKFFGKLMYREYYENRFKNKRFYTFLINNCKNLDYYWLENIHKEISSNSWTKTKCFFQIQENSNEDSVDEVDGFLSSFKLSN